MPAAITEDLPPNPTLLAIGKRIAELRTARGLQQADLAKAAGVGLTSVQTYEKGAREMGICSALAIADVLGTTVQALLSPDVTGPMRMSPLYFTGVERARHFCPVSTRRLA